MIFFYFTPKFLANILLPSSRLCLHMDAAVTGGKFLLKSLDKLWGGERLSSIYRLGVRNYVTLKTGAAFPRNNCCKLKKRRR
jgi:hypothetical protein